MKAGPIKALAFGCMVVLTATGLSLSGQKKPAPAPALEPCAPTQVTPWPEGLDPTRDWVRGLHALQREHEELKQALNARPITLRDDEMEALLRQIEARLQRGFTGTISGKTIVITPRPDAPIGRR